MKNPGTLTGEVINSLLQLPLSLAACTPVLRWRNRRMHPALTSLIINDREEWIISRREIFKFWGKKVEHLLHLNKEWDGLSPCFAPVFHRKMGLKRRVKGQVPEGVSVVNTCRWWRPVAERQNETMLGWSLMNVWLEDVNATACPPWLSFSCGRLLLPMQPRLHRCQMWAGPRRLREQFVQLQLGLSGPPSGERKLSHFGFVICWRSVF